MKLILFLTVTYFTSRALAGRCDKYWLEKAEIAQLAPDVCHNEFETFLICLVGKIEDTLDHAIQEASPEVAEASKSCFSSGGCGSVSYVLDDALEQILPCDVPKSETRNRKKKCLYRTAADQIFELLDRIPKPVGKCMIRYFKGIGERKIEDCVRDYPPPSGPLTPEYNMPELPGFEDFELEEVKHVLLYHIVSRYTLKKCHCEKSLNDRTQLIGCLTQHISDMDQDVCESREECEQGVQSGTTCGDRYEATRDSVCRCAESELKKGLNALNDWQELKKTFVRGDWQCEFERCYVDAGLLADWEGRTGMKRKINSVKASVIKAFLAYSKDDDKPKPTGLADAVEVFKSILDELMEKWAGFLCGDCSAQQISSGDLTRKTLNKMLDDTSCKAGKIDVGNVVGLFNKGR